MFKSISRAFELYMKRPVQYVSATLYWVFFLGLSLFAVLGVYILFFFFMAGIKYTNDLVPFAVAASVLGIILLYLYSSFKGALIKAYSTIAAGSKFSILDFYSYGISKGWTFFTLSIVKLFLLVLVNLPSVFVYTTYLKTNPMQYVDIILLLISLALTFLVELLFYPAYISAAVYNTGFKQSFGSSFRLFAKGHLFAILLFVIYAFVCVMNIIPIIQVLSLFIAFPIIYLAMITFFQNYAGKSK